MFAHATVHAHVTNMFFGANKRGRSEPCSLALLGTHCEDWLRVVITKKKKAETSWDTVIEAKAMAAYVLPKKESVNFSSWGWNNFSGMSVMADRTHQRELGGAPNGDCSRISQLGPNWKATTPQIPVFSHALDVLILPIPIRTS